MWLWGTSICDLFGVNKTPTKVDDLGRDLWLSSVLSTVEIASLGEIKFFDFFVVCKVF